MILNAKYWNIVEASKLIKAATVLVGSNSSNWNSS